MGDRSEAETARLRAEAERRARAGDSRTDISRALGVPLTTLANWAVAGGWRGKDIAAEQAEVVGRMFRNFDAINEAEKKKPGSWLEVELELPPDGAKPSPLFAPPPERPAWAEREVRVRTPPWAPGDAIRTPEEAALYLADDLMRQGLLVEAERALRFARAWLEVSERVFRKRDKDDEAYEQAQKEMEAEQTREAFSRAVEEARAARRGGGSSSNSAAAPADGQA